MSRAAFCSFVYKAIKVLNVVLNNAGISFKDSMSGEEQHLNSLLVVIVYYFIKLVV